MAMPSVSMAVVWDSSLAQVSPASADLNRWPRKPNASSPSPRMGDEAEEAALVG